MSDSTDKRANKNDPPTPMASPGRRTAPARAEELVKDKWQRLHADGHVALAHKYNDLRECPKCVEASRDRTRWCEPCVDGDHGICDRVDCTCTCLSDDESGEAAHADAARPLEPHGGPVAVIRERIARQDREQHQYDCADTLHADRRELLKYHDTEREMHHAWRKRAEEAEAALRAAEARRPLVEDEENAEGLPVQDKPLTGNQPPEIGGKANG